MTTTLTTIDEILKRVSNGYFGMFPLWSERTASPTGSVLTGISCNGTKLAGDVAMPSLPSGVTAFIPSGLTFMPSTTACGVLFGRLTNLGSINIATPTFTDGSSMPTVKEFGANAVQSSIVLAEVTTQLNVSPGSLQITYTSQDGTASKSSSSQAMAGSSVVGSIGIVQLATGDTGVRDITAATRTGGSSPSGVLKFWGIEPLFMGTGMRQSSAQSFGVANLIGQHMNAMRFGASDVFGGFLFRPTATTFSLVGSLFVVGDN